MPLVPPFSTSLPAEEIGELRHDLLNRLGHVVGFAEIILEDFQESDTGPFSMGVREIIRLVNDMLTDISHRLSNQSGITRQAAQSFGTELIERSRSIVSAVEKITADPGDEAPLMALEDLERVREAAIEFESIIEAGLGTRAPNHVHQRKPQRDAGDTDGVPNKIGTPELPEDGEAGINGTVLVVDDHTENRQLVARRLDSLDCHIVEASSGEQALAILKSNPVDLILLDVRMPGISGFDVCERLKTDPDTASIPIIFLTAAHDPDEIVNGLNLGAVDYVLKPFRPAELLARARTHLGYKLARDELGRYAERMAAMNHQKDSFLKIASHDLRNPLSNVQHFCQRLMQAAAGRDPQSAESIREIGKATRRMLDIVANFLDYQKAMSGKIAVKPEIIEVMSLVQEVVASNQRQAVEKGMVIHTELPEGLPPVVGDPAQCVQILTNFLTNGLKFSPPGSSVAIRADSQSDQIRIQVHDQGPGVKESERDELFKEFGRVSTKTTASESSTGLGLAIVKRLAEAQGGAVGAEFPAGGGAVFWFSLPAKSD